MAASVYDRKVRPSGWWYAAAAGIAVGGILAGLAVAAKGVDNALEAVRSFDRSSVPGILDVTIDEPGGYSIYQEFPGASDAGGSTEPPQVIVTDPTGAAVELDTYDTFVSYDQANVEGRGIYTFRAEQAGDYRIVSAGAPGSTIAVGRGMGDLSAEAAAGLFGGMVGGAVLALFGIVAGITVAICVGVARGRSRRRRPVAIPIPVSATGPFPGAVPVSLSAPVPGAGRPSGYAPVQGYAPTGTNPWLAPTPQRVWPTAAPSPQGHGGPTVTLPYSGMPSPTLPGPPRTTLPTGAPTAPPAAVPVSAGATSPAPGSAGTAPVPPGAPTTVPAQPGGAVTGSAPPGTAPAPRPPGPEPRVMVATGAAAGIRPGSGEPTLLGPAPTVVETDPEAAAAATEPLSRPGDPQSLRSPVDWSRSDVELPWEETGQSR